MSIGYREWSDKRGNEKRTWVMSHEKLVDIWEKVANYQSIVRELEKQKELPRNWNKHDEGIIDGFEKHVRPFQIPDGRFLDPIQDQLDKYYKAVKKIREVTTNEYNYSRKDFLDEMDITPPTKSLSKNYMKQHMDERRALSKKLIEW